MYDSRESSAAVHRPMDGRKFKFMRNLQLFGAIHRNTSEENLFEIGFIPVRELERDVRFGEPPNVKRTLCGYSKWTLCVVMPVYEWPLPPRVPTYAGNSKHAICQPI